MKCKHSARIVTHSSGPVVDPATAELTLDESAQFVSLPESVKAAASVEKERVDQQFDCSTQCALSGLSVRT
jgi:hypothetical protein